MKAKRLTNIKELASSYLGLFWFKDDYSDFDMQVADKEFDQNDLDIGDWIAPEMEHKDYRDDPFRLPRGRVEIDEGQVEIYVGEKCPDSAVEMVKRDYGLLKYGDKVAIFKAPYWDVNKGGINDSLDIVRKHLKDI
jgi:hypothetical protein